MDDAFASRVRELTALSEHQPDRYRRGVLFWTLLGYTTLVGALVGGLALILGLVGVAAALVLSMRVLVIKLLFKGGFLLLLPLLALVRVLLGALRVRIPPPDGCEVTEAQMPALFALIDEVRTPLGVARPRHVLLTGELNAAVAEVPRLGVLPWFTSYLLVGVPLMQALSEEEIKSVLAHEFGHLSNSDGQLGSWVYRVQQSWFRIASAVEHQDVGGAGMLSRFFAWYLPRYSAWTFVLRRSQEYMADAASASATGARTAADALLRVELAAKAMDDNADHIRELVSQQDKPPTDFYEALGRRLLHPGDETVRQGWLDEAMREATGYADSHPCLRDRLAALGQAVRLPPALERSAAEVVLGDAHDAVLAERSGAWREQVRGAWWDRHHQVKRQRDRLQELEGQESRSRDEWMEWARLIGELRTTEDAVMAWSQVVDRHPDDAEAAFHLGTEKLAREQEDGLEHLRRACELDPEAVIPAARAAAAFLSLQGREDEIREWQRRFDARLDHLESEHEQRARFEVDTGLSPHGLTLDQVEHIKELLRHSDGVLSAWLYRKDAPGEPVYVLALQTTRTSEWDADDAAAYAAAGFEVPGVQGDWHILALHQLDKSLRAKLTADPDAELVF